MSRLERLYEQFPALTPDNHRITSPDDDKYNCVAWVNRDLDGWWEPGFCWPNDLEVSGAGDLDAYVELFRRWGYEPCDDSAYEPGYLKLGVYAEGGDFLHVAKQLRDGTWSSKAGVLNDFKHSDLGVLEGSWALQFASVVIVMRRADDGGDPMTVECGQLITP